MLDKVAELLSKIHHKFGVAVDFIDELRKHGNQLLDAPLRAQQLGNLAEPLDRVHLRVGVFAAEVVDQKCDGADCVDLVHLTGCIHVIFRHFSN